MKNLIDDIVMQYQAKKKKDAAYSSQTVYVSALEVIKARKYCADLGVSFSHLIDQLIHDFNKECAKRPL